jgi:hypothetical protein
LSQDYKKEKKDRRFVVAFYWGCGALAIIGLVLALLFLFILPGENLPRYDLTDKRHIWYQEH